MFVSKTKHRFLQKQQKYENSKIYCSAITPLRAHFFLANVTISTGKVAYTYIQIVENTNILQVYRFIFLRLRFTLHIRQKNVIFARLYFHMPACSFLFSRQIAARIANARQTKGEAGKEGDRRKTL